MALFATAIYNLFFHPLAKVPGPFLARVSGLPSWYHAYRGDRHVWLWQQFQVYGSKIRPEPNTVVFNDPEAYACIYSMKANVRRSNSYEVWKRDEGDKTTLVCVDVEEHARKRKLLNLCFTDKSVRASSELIVNHVDRWNQLLGEGHDDWSETVDFSGKVDALVFDILGDLCFRKSFDIKEPGENPLRDITHSPLLNFVLWLKPRGLNKVLELLTPPVITKCYEFLRKNVLQRIALEREQAEKPESEKRLDMFHYLCEARDPDAGIPAYTDAEIQGETSLLIIAGSDTTAISLSGIFFYLTQSPYQYQKLVKEIRSTFETVDEIVYGPKLSSCVYLRACIDEGMRLSPSQPSELSREALPGGITVNGEYYPAGTMMGASAWASYRNDEVFGDASVIPTGAVDPGRGQSWPGLPGHSGTGPPDALQLQPLFGRARQLCW